MEMNIKDVGLHELQKLEELFLSDRNKLVLYSEGKMPSHVREEDYPYRIFHIQKVELQAVAKSYLFSDQSKLSFSIEIRIVEINKCFTYDKTKYGNIASEIMQCLDRCKKS